MDKIEENDQLARLLKRLVENYTLLAMPTIKENERPDFILTSEGVEIGVEVTNSVFQEYRRGDKLRHQFLSDQCVTTTNLVDGDKCRTNDELLSEMLSVNSLWKDTSQALEEWNQKVTAAVTIKRKSFNKPGYNHFPKNWLLVFDNPPLENDVITKNAVTDYMNVLFCQNQPDVKKDFDALFVLSGRYLFWYENKRLRLNYK